MTGRDTQIATFLKASGYEGCPRTPIAGDASMRRYERVQHPKGHSMILMDAPPDTGENVTPFVTVAHYLHDLGVSVPQIYAEDREHGLLLLEDLGNDDFDRVIHADATQERALYRAATDLLLDLHKAPAPDLAPLGPRVLAEMASLVLERYRGDILGPVDAPLMKKFENQLEDALRPVLRSDMVFVHRDFHAQNLFWLPKRVGVKRVGVIDFQDARIGHPAYDLVSLLQDARRDVPAGIEMQMIDRYIDHSGVDDAGFRSAYAVIGVQRNLRILGIFARLSRDYGKPGYIDLIPRVWEHVRCGLEHPALGALSDWLLDELPAPTPENLDRLRR